ncbi:hypothetical protein SOMG_02301 [Schizosaccharomyces osmophilus]|uniref:Uncharacterized protein n=1 Tax=Schizosaccharomyces osmophilus TaxID=2545709 RepID=A0AAF0ASW6_9SCHI|nr:uncharacterized protein SOMG_02301 [Schizosaccharomyces osmophilus]WBW71176.1 hypothetical protein SOMG_02301 [Schizosaccharomyces osmophilus]
MACMNVRNVPGKACGKLTRNESPPAVDAYIVKQQARFQSGSKFDGFIFFRLIRGLTDGLWIRQNTWLLCLVDCLKETVHAICSMRSSSTRQEE